MRTSKVAVSLEKGTLERLDRMVAERVFPSRSGAIQEAVAEKLARMERSRLAAECAKLDRRAEQALAEEGTFEESDA
jgi:metal-responsive CopG/Arc/MetJ family transcriptional regulator